MAGASFQTQINVQYAFGVPGALYDDSPVRSAPWILNSASAAYNIIGATAFTALTADPGDASTAGTAKAGGTGQFIGVLANLKTAVTSGNNGALNPSASLPNNQEGEMVSMGHLIVTLPGSANVGDNVSYDATTGALSTFPKIAVFTGAIVAATGLLTVSAITAGFLQPGMTIQGVGFTAQIVSFGTGLGGTGTYHTNYLSGAADVSSEAMTGNMTAPPATSFTATVATTGVMTVSAVGSGQIVPGQVLAGVGLSPNTIVQPYGTNSTSGEGGTGTYQVSPAPAVAVSVGETVTADQQIAIPRAEVIIIAPQGNGGLGVISLTNA